MGFDSGMWFYFLLIAAVLIGMLRGIAIQHFINSRAVDLDETAKVIKRAFSDMMGSQ